MIGSWKRVDPGGDGLVPLYESLVWGVHADGKRKGYKKRARFRTEREFLKWHGQRALDVQNGLLETVRDKKVREAADRERAEREKKNAERETLAALLDAWFAEHRGSLAGSTATRYAGLIVLLKPFLDGVSVRTFTRLDAKAFFPRFAASGGKGGKPLGRSSVSQARTLVYMALEDAVDSEVVDTNVVAGLKLKLKKPLLRKPPTAEQVQRLHDAASAEAFQDLLVPIVLGSSCGMRRGESLAAKWSNTNLEQGWIDVMESVEEVGKLVGLKEPKTEASKRRIELDPDVVAILRQHRARQREDAFRCGPGYDRASDLICPRPDGSLWRPSNFTTRFLKFARALGVDHSYHDLRHFHATALLDAGVDPVVVSHRLGHTDVKFTLTRYCHVLTDSGRRAADTFGRYMRGRGPVGANEAAS